MMLVKCQEGAVHDLAYNDGGFVRTTCGLQIWNGYELFQMSANETLLSDGEVLQHCPVCWEQAMSEARSTKRLVDETEARWKATSAAHPYRGA